MRALLLHNPTAGTGGHDKADILAALKLAGFETRYASTNEAGRWAPMDRFVAITDEAEAPDLRYWRGGLVVSTPDAVARMCAASST